MLILILQGIIFVVGVGLAIYVALWNLFILSIVDGISIITQMVGGVDGLGLSLAWDILKIMIASIVGWGFVMGAITLNVFIGEFK